jgi:mevalonate kinase
MKFKEKNESVFADLCKKESKLVEEAILLLKQNDLQSLGKRMNENQKYLEQIGVSNKKLGSMIELAQKTAYGAKLTGAGDGGCIIALTDETNLEKTLRNFQGKYECFSTKIDYAGLDTF